jgi:hypothetical protein
VLNDGGALVRLDVTHVAQTKRLSKRDGFVRTDRAMTYPGEPPRSWTRFGSRVRTDQFQSPEVALLDIDAVTPVMT